VSWFYVLTIFIVVYATSQLNLPRGLLLNAISVAAVVEAIAIPLFGWLSDHIGRRIFYFLGTIFTVCFAFPLFWLLSTKDPQIITLTVVVALTFGHGAKTSARRNGLETRGPDRDGPGAGRNAIGYKLSQAYSSLAAGKVGSRERDPGRQPAGSGEVDRETLEIGERAVGEGALVRGPQDHAGRLARFVRFLPTGCAEAPAVAGLQAAKAEFRYRRRQVIAAGFRKLEKFGRHDSADRVTADVLSAGVATAVTKEPRHRVHRADFKPVAEDIPRCARPTASLCAVVSQHCHLPRAAMP
jgi:hypothetical protein